uniref:Uncharacterized protein n=1 Tax=Arundo donax TaxID=35708 RepID=A0A0A9C771_ARUDO
MVSLRSFTTFMASNTDVQVEARNAQI